MKPKLRVQYYVIRHKETGNYMPQKMFRTATGGYSFWEPTNAGGMGGVGFPAIIPRLFTNKQSAQTAITYWLKGNAEKMRDYDGEFEGLAYNPPVISRKREDLEVITVTLREE